MAVKQGIKVSTKEIGATGTVILGGIIQDDEYNNELNGTARYEIVDKMRKSDATVRASLLVVKLPLLSANWFMQPASDDKRDIEISDTVQWNLKEAMSVSWDEFLREALLYLDFGHYVFEKLWRVDEYNGRQITVLDKLAARLPRTIYRWETEDGQPGITQHTLEKGYVSIPNEKLLKLTNEKEGSNQYGQTILRAAYKHWYIKDNLYKIDAIAHERQGLGIPYVKPPTNAGKTDKAKARELIQNIRANEKGYLDIPEGWEVGFLDMKSSTTRNPENTIKHHDRQIPKSVLAQFLELGAGSVGSYALQEGQGDLFMLAEQSYANYIRDALQKSVVKQIVDMNYDNVKSYPKLMYERIGTIDVGTLSTALQRFMQAGVLEPDDELERYVRNVSQLPEKPDRADLPADFGDDMAMELENELGTVEGDLNGESFVAENPPGQDLTPQELDQAASNFMEDMYIGARGPLSDEHKDKIREALKRYWESRRKQIQTKGGGKKGKGGKNSDPRIKEARGEIRGLKDDLRKFRDDMKRERLELQAKGEKMTQEERAKKELEYMDKKNSINERISKLRETIDSIKEASQPKDSNPDNPDNPDNQASDKGLRAFFKSIRSVIRG